MSKQIATQKPRSIHKALSARASRVAARKRAHGREPTNGREPARLDATGETEPPTPGDTSAFHAAYERRLPEILAVKEEAFVAINLDVHAVVARVIGALSRIKALEQQLQALPDADQSLLAGLEDYARATGEAQLRYEFSLAPGSEIQALNEEAIHKRETLRTDAAALVQRGLLEPDALLGFKGSVGYKNVSFELMGYADVLRNAWPHIAGKTALTLDEIQAAKDLGAQLFEAAGLRDVAPADVAETARIRQQAYSLLFHAYTETRRCVQYLRFNEGDADTIAPSVFTVRARSAAAEPAPEPVPPTPSPPSPSPSPAPEPPVVTAPANGATPAHDGNPAPAPANVAPVDDVSESNA